MQPKSIDSRHLIDIDAQKRLVDLEGIQHLRSVSEHKEHPAETDYDVVHDEASRRNREQLARQFVDKLNKADAEHAEEPAESAEEKPPAKSKSVSSDEKGSHLDVEA